ncbi:MAG: KpsF/GutQ family sugar-phosphate isomerase [Burkholderiales bacterium]|jgi:arabinose-5-phosphate isomerase|nr:KpsF/GutQ family sugar-phosphate isomerase [Burkholderiales bacterium]
MQAAPNLVSIAPTPVDAAIARGRRVLEIESRAVARLATRLDASFAAALELILGCRGRLVVSGIGKSGHVAGKLAATFASTGTPAFFVHPAEAGHGDLGMITADDVMLALSYSGESSELVSIVPLAKRRGARLIAMTGRPTSALARLADVHLDASVEEEACPLGLAPTASTTAALALGDALAVAALEARGFSADDFAQSHPGGSLGRRLLTHVRDVMRTGDAIPRVARGAALTDALFEVTGKGLGMTAVVDTDDRPVGVFTDGDLRRALARGVDLRTARVDDVMTPAPQTLGAERLAVEAVEAMERRRINGLLVTDPDGRLAGALNMHDLFTAGVL